MRVRFSRVIVSRELAVWKGDRRKGERARRLGRWLLERTVAILRSGNDSQVVIPGDCLWFAQSGRSKCAMTNSVALSGTWRIIPLLTQARRFGDSCSDADDKGRGISAVHSRPSLSDQDLGGNVVGCGQRTSGLDK